MEVSQNKKDKDLVRKKGDELYYSKGYDDPDFSVLKFTAHQAKQYSNFKVEEIAIK
ncbi:MAG: hypothetical protein LBP53_02490 [Candidatus Peribacteria bacterium]|jgi:general stress protein 26|nr:hypothetical protein [Candidatus Peribacteria bacterium]